FHLAPYPQGEKIWASRLDRLAQDNIKQINELTRQDTNVPSLSGAYYAESTASGISGQFAKDWQTNQDEECAVSEGSQPKRQEHAGYMMQDVVRPLEPPMVGSKYEGMVFLLHRLREHWKRDVISIREFLLPRANGLRDAGQPDWGVLLERINNVEDRTDGAY